MRDVVRYVPLKVNSRYTVAIDLIPSHGGVISYAGLFFIFYGYISRCLFILLLRSSSQYWLV